MGYPNPAESPLRPVHDRPRRLRPSTALGLKVGDDLIGARRPPLGRRHRRRRLPLGHRLRGAEQRRRPEEEAPGHPQRQQDVDLPARRRPGRLPRPGADDRGLQRLEQARSASSCPTIPLVGDQADRWLQQIKDAIKASLHGGMLFEELGFRYIGPIDGHDLPTLAQLPREGQGDGRARCCCTS